MNEIMDGRELPNPADNLKRLPKKSILKSSSSFEVTDSAAGPSKRKSTIQPSIKETKWDEKNIQETLHPTNKDYGHMKIDEPKTPYERLFSEEVAAGVKGVDPKALSDRLKENQKRDPRQTNRPASAGQGTSKGPPPPPPRGTSKSDSSDEEMTPDKLAKKKDFEKKRKAHYNEFAAAKEALKNIKDDEDEE